MARGKGSVKGESMAPSMKAGHARSEQAGVYDTLLFVSLGFLLMGITFLLLELMKYGFVMKP